MEEFCPPPVNISPMVAVNPRRPPHQSATARVPYGSRISGGYNRYGNRFPRNKIVFDAGEYSTDGNPITSTPRIMNPHASEFVPVWYLVPPSGYMASPNRIPVSPVSPSSFPMSPNGIPESPNGYPASLNGTLVTQNGLATSPSNSVDSEQFENVEIDLENKNQDSDEESKNASSTEVRSEKQQVKQNPQEDHFASNENFPKIEKSGDLLPTARCSQEDKVTMKDTVTEKMPSKCWGDYSDSEADMIEVKS